MVTIVLTALTAVIPEMAITVPRTADTEIEIAGIAEMLTGPVTTAVTVPVATTINPVAVAVSPEDAVVNAALSTETVPLTRAEPVKLTTVVPAPAVTVPVITTGNAVVL